MNLENRKVYIKDVPVSILNETVKYYDADGKLITESIVEYSGKNLKRVYEKYEDFEQEWYRADSKKDFLNHLFNEGVMIDALYDKLFIEPFISGAYIEYEYMQYKHYKRC